MAVRPGVPVALDSRGDPAAGDPGDEPPRGGMGRIDIVEDRLVGIKSREVYGARSPAIAAHQELENVTLEREQARFGGNRSIEQRWTELGLRRHVVQPAQALARVFVDDTQRYVSGDVRLVCAAGARHGQASDASLYDFNLATCDEVFVRPVAGQGIHRDLRSPREARRRAQREARRRSGPRDGSAVTQHDDQDGTAGLRADETARVRPRPGRRPVRGRPRRRARRAEQVRAASTGASRARTSRARRLHEGLARGPACSTTTAARPLLAALERLARGRVGRVSSRPTTTRTCTPRWSAGSSSGPGPSSASCAQRLSATRPRSRR